MNRNTNAQTDRQPRLAWVEGIKAVALLWIFLNHFSEIFFGPPFIANPTSDWPALTDRIAQLAPLTDFGVWNLPANILRYIGWMGDQGVQLFLITSGFGLTWGYLSRNLDSQIPKKEFYFQRAFRLYPLWWAAHLFFLATWLILGWGFAPGVPFAMSFLGIRLTPGLFYFFSPAWWYFGLILQLYLIFPYLWDALRRLGPSRLLILALGLSLPLRAAGLFLFHGYLDVWQRGGVFISRLPEFVFGMCFAAWLYSNPQGVERIFRNSRMVALAVVAYVIALALSLTLPGMIVAPWLSGVSLFILLYLALTAILPRLSGGMVTAGTWLGEHSYSLYLVHHPVFLFLFQYGTFSPGIMTILASAALLGTGVIAILLEQAVGFLTRVIQGWAKSTDVIKALIRIGIAGALLIGILLAGEMAVRRWDPQEIFGWGERPSLQPDDVAGWKLVPSQTTRLRWQSYDYIVSANALGYPGPDFPLEKPSETFRVLVVGDAFSSAEGVDTADAWPRLLQTDLSDATGKDVQVMNFAITGYGPEQYAAVVEYYAPIYRPDLILVELFVNDFLDVQTSTEAFHASIGFDRPDQTGLYSIVRLEHLRQYLRQKIAEPLREAVFRQTPFTGYFLGNFTYFEKAKAGDLELASAQVAERLKRIQSVAEHQGAGLMVVIVPAPIQVCEAEQLGYYPRSVNFDDVSVYDHELPQRLFVRILNDLRIPHFDLRDAFAHDTRCPYQPRNMHWTEEGHASVAGYVAEILREQGYPEAK